MKIGEQSLGVAISDVKIHVRMCFDKTGKSRYDRIFSNGHGYAKGQHFFFPFRLSCIRFFNVFSSFLMVSRAERKISPAGVSRSFFLISYKKLGTVGLFQMFDMLGNCGLCQIQVLGSMCKFISLHTVRNVSMRKSNIIVSPFSDVFILKS